MKLNEAIAQFTQDYSFHTARSYRCGLMRWIHWMRETGMPVTETEELEHRWVIPFARAMKREGLSPRSVAAYLTAVVQFLEWGKLQKTVSLTAEQFFELKASVRDWNGKNKVRKLAKLPDESAVVTVLEGAHSLDAETERGRLVQLRNAAMLELLASTGCRISEAVNLKRDDLIPDKMAAMVRGGKGRKDRMIVFATEEAWKTVQLYLKERDRFGFKTMGDEPVIGRHDPIAHSRGEIMPVSPESMRIALRKILKETDADYFTPHQLRHRAATWLLRKTGNPAIVQQYLGHANVSTTIGTYTHLETDDLIKAIRE